MSYTLTVSVRAGTPSVTMSGDVPDGTFEVAGHEDATESQLSVARRTPDGRYAVRAGHTHSKEQ